MEETKKDSVKDKSPKVVVFGNAVNEEENGWKHDHFNRHHRRHGSFVWGLFFILIGLMFLLSNFGALPPVVWSQIAHLWPILIILIGFETIIGHSYASDIIYSVLGLFIFFTILGVIFINISPNMLSGLPVSVVNYFHQISLYLSLK